jgi:DNA topoisomerase-2
MKNEEITALKQILGLQHGKDYQDVNSLRYGHIMIMADQVMLHSSIQIILFS